MECSKNSKFIAINTYIKKKKDFKKKNNNLTYTSKSWKLKSELNSKLSGRKKQSRN